MDTEQIVEILRQLPEVRLRVLDLAWMVTRDDGSVDREKLLFHARELEEAFQEARAYAEATRESVRCLKSIPRSDH